MTFVGTAFCAMRISPNRRINPLSRNLKSCLVQVFGRQAVVELEQIAKRNEKVIINYVRFVIPRCGNRLLEGINDEID